MCPCHKRFPSLLLPDAFLTLFLGHPNAMSLETRVLKPSCTSESPENILYLSWPLPRAISLTTSRGHQESAFLKVPPGQIKQLSINQGHHRVWGCGTDLATIGQGGEGAGWRPPQTNSPYLLHIVFPFTDSQVIKYSKLSCLSTILAFETILKLRGAVSLFFVSISIKEKETGS